MQQHREVGFIAKRLCRLVHQSIVMLASAMNSSVLFGVPALMRNPDADVDMWLEWLSRAPINCTHRDLTVIKLENFVFRVCNKKRLFTNVVHIGKRFTHSAVKAVFESYTRQWRPVCL